MAEGSYEYECMRAELLGLPKPDEQEFLEKQKERLACQAEQIEEKTIEEVENQNDDLKHVSGGLEELNSILSITQKKLNRFKNACGSLTNLLKIKVGQSDSTESIPTKESEEGEADCSDSNRQTVSQQEPEASVQNGARHNDMLARALDKQTDKLDSLIIGAENAQYRLAHQNKQIKSFLK